MMQNFMKLQLENMENSHLFSLKWESADFILALAASFFICVEAYIYVPQSIYILHSHS